MLTYLNDLGGANGVGRLDIVENRYVGMKSRGAYETPGGTIMLRTHRGIESITLDREVAHLKDSLMPRYAELIYNGYWWSPEREMLQVAIDHSQRYVNGEVRVKLYKGNVDIVGRRVGRIRCLTRKSQPSKKMRVSITRVTPRASSSSMPCGCATLHGNGVESWQLCGKGDLQQTLRNRCRRSMTR